LWLGETPRARHRHWQIQLEHPSPPSAVKCVVISLAASRSMKKSSLGGKLGGAQCITVSESYRAVGLLHHGVGACAVPASVCRLGAGGGPIIARVRDTLGSSRPFGGGWPAQITLSCCADHPGGPGPGRAGGRPGSDHDARGGAAGAAPASVASETPAPNYGLGVAGESRPGGPGPAPRPLFMMPAVAVGSMMILRVRVTVFAKVS
jgi:hypothetical protein